MTRHDFDDIFFNGQVTFAVLPVRTPTKSKSVATPKINNIEFLQFVNTVAQNVTDFVGGQDGQVLKILGDGFTTIVYNTAKVYTNTAANKLLAANKVYTFSRFSSKWYEDA